MHTLITNGHIVTAADDYTGDILIDGETITATGRRTLSSILRGSIASLRPAV